MDLLEQFSAAYLHQRLDYNPITGVLLWNEQEAHTRHEKIWNARYANKPAGYLKYEKIGGPYLNLKLDRVALKAHRVIWKMTYGESPPEIIDHADLDTVNNRIINLRDATAAQNRQNHKVRSDNTTGVTGVYFRKDRQQWQAAINVAGHYTHLGIFKTKEEAIQIRLAAEIQHYGEFSPAKGLKS